MAILGGAEVEVTADMRKLPKQVVAGMRNILRRTKKEAERAGSDTGKGFGRGIRKGFQSSIKGMLNYVGQVARGTGKVFLSSISDSLANLPPHIQAGVIATFAGMAAAVAPAIGAALQGALVTGVGLAGIGAGIALAFRDPRIKDAASGVGKDILGVLTRAAASFQVPLLKSLEIVRKGFRTLEPTLKQAFDLLSPLVEDLTQGFMNFIHAAMPGFISGFRQAQPLIRMLANQLPRLGDAITTMFEEFEEGSDGAIMGLKVLLDGLEGFLILVGKAVGGLSKLFEAWVRMLTKFPNPLQDWAKGMVSDMELAKAEVTGLTGPTQGLANAFGSAAGEASGFGRTLTDLFEPYMSVTEAQINLEESIDQVREAFRKNGETININTEAGRANVTAVLDVISAAASLRDAEIAAGGSVSAANAKFNAQIGALAGVLSKAGLTGAQIESLIGKYRKVPPAVSTTIKTPGLNTAVWNAEKLLALTQKLMGIRTVGSTGRPSGDPRRQRPPMAEGGIVTVPQERLIGEAGPEVVLPLNKPGRMNELMNKAGITGMGTPQVNVYIGSERLESRMIKVVKANSVQQARTVRAKPRSL